MNKYRLLKYNLKDKVNNIPYTVTKIIPKKKKKVNYLQSVDDILQNLQIPENKEIRLCVLANRGWRGTSGNFYSNIEDVRNHLYDPRSYAPEGQEQEVLENFKISRIKIITREKRMRF